MLTLSDEDIVVHIDIDIDIDHVIPLMYAIT
jgi:hypothetical protein